MTGGLGKPGGLCQSFAVRATIDVNCEKGQRHYEVC